MNRFYLLFLPLLLVPLGAGKSDTNDVQIRRAMDRVLALRWYIAELEQITLSEFTRNPATFDEMRKLLSELYLDFHQMARVEVPVNADSLYSPHPEDNSVKPFYYNNDTQFQEKEEREYDGNVGDGGEYNLGEEKDGFLLDREAKIWTLGWYAREIEKEVISILLGRKKDFGLVTVRLELFLKKIHPKGGGPGGGHCQGCRYKCCPDGTCKPECPKK